MNHSKCLFHIQNVKLKIPVFFTQLLKYSNFIIFSTTIVSQTTLGKPTSPTKEATSIDRYESHIHTSANTLQHFYLTDVAEENRRVFYLFRATNDHWQDLIRRQSFSFDDTEIAQKWLEQTIKKYQLIPAPSDSKNDPDFFPFSVETPSSSTAPQNIPADEKLWEATNEWDTQWEIEYGRWVGQVLTPQFMMDIQLPTDCADVAYTLRWVFAYLNKLPMAVRLGGSRQLFTNESMLPDWKNLPRNDDWKKDQRFRAALLYILRNTYTHTLMSDSYPIAINQEKLTPGTYHLTLHEQSGHTMIVNKVNEPNNLPITLLYSTTPIKIRELIASYFLESADPRIYQTGFYKIRWSKKLENGWKIIPSKSIPDYSEEQFQLNEMNNFNLESNPYFIRVYKKLNPNFSFETMMNRSVDELKARIMDRVQVVEEGFHFCQVNDCSPGSQGEEDWSTPNRDQRLIQIHQSINTAALFLKNYDNDKFQQWRDKIALLAKEKFLTFSNKTFSLEQIVIALLYKLVQANPRLPIDQRWGLSATTGYGLTLMSKLEDIVKQRQSLIDQAAPCRKQMCKNASSNFEKLNTLALDREITNLWTGAQLLCDVAEPNECADIKSILQTKSFQNKTYWDWFLKVPGWISNPNASIVNRWGDSLRIFYPSDNSSLSPSAFFSKNRDWFSMNGALYQTTNFLKVTPPHPEKMGQIHPTENEYYTYEPNNNNLILRFYHFPQQKFSEMTLNGISASPLRIWWTGPNKNTVSLFTRTQYYELAPNESKILKQLPIKKFRVLPFDHRVTIIETKNGLEMSDATTDASHFIKLPKFNGSISFFQRTNLGWAFKVDNRFFYIDTESHILFDLNTNIYGTSFLNVTGDHLFLYNLTNDSVEVHKMVNNGRLGKSFKLDKKLSGQLYYHSELHLTMIESSPQGYKHTTYQLNPLQIINLACSKSSLQPRLVNDEYYMCSDKDDSENSKELHHISGALVKSDLELNELPEPLLLHKNLQSNKQDLLTISKRSQSQLPPRYAERFSYSEYFSANEKRIKGPIIQSIHQWERFNSMSAEPTLNATDSTAPPWHSPLEFSNFAVVKQQNYVPSFVLDNTIGFSRYKHILIIF